MTTLPATSSDDDLKAVVTRWVSLLADRNYTAAIEMLHPGDGPWRWTPELLETYIKNYGSEEPMRDGSTYTVTRLGSAELIPDGRRHHFDVDREHLFGLDPNSYVGMVHIELPLNGNWSDLTARLKIRKAGSGRIALELLDVTVM